MKDNFSRCLAYVLKSEGGYVNNPADKGGPTNYGITQAVYDEYRKSHGLPLQSVEDISGIEVEAIYLLKYWEPIQGDSLPSGVDYCTFDYAVNSGIVRAVRALQKAVGVDVDGIVGPQTIAAANAAPDVIDAICDARLAFLKGLSNWKVFGRGWSKRVSDVRKQAKGMVQ